MSMTLRVVLIIASLLTMLFMLKRIRNAKVQIEDVIFWIIFSTLLIGLSIFPELGDYFAGPNHVLPTNGTAKFFSPLGVDDFIKKSSIIYYSREALESVHQDIEDFAEAEYLTAHANSVRVRFE